MLIDRFGRIHDYLRISITEKCNLSCVYCVPDEGIGLKKNTIQMTADEIATIAQVFIGLGVKKIRLTGGEPLFRKDFSEIARKLSGFPVSLSVTTNGVILDKYLTILKESNFNSLNISLDTLEEQKFNVLTKRNEFQKVLNNTFLALNMGFKVKINVVAMKGYIESEILNFVSLTEKYPLQLRFIEMMPFDGNDWKKEKVITEAEMLKIIENEKKIIKLQGGKNETDKMFKVEKSEGSFGFISTMSDHFCSTCNRLRVTADGKIKNCLFGKDELDLLTSLRKGEPITEIIKKSLFLKHEKLGGQLDEDFQKLNHHLLKNRSMIAIGG
ncbi:MAG: GTP 3',8-cyclase MoaA [Cytophagales bacterium]